MTNDRLFVSGKNWSSIHSPASSSSGGQMIRNDGERKCAFSWASLYLLQSIKTEVPPSSENLTAPPDRTLPWSVSPLCQKTLPPSVVDIDHYTLWQIRFECAFTSHGVVIHFTWYLNKPEFQCQTSLLLSIHALYFSLSLSLSPSHLLLLFVMTCSSWQV